MSLNVRTAEPEEVFIGVNVMCTLLLLGASEQRVLEGGVRWLLYLAFSVPRVCKAQLRGMLLSVLRHC